MWTVDDSSSLYGLNRWGDHYFSINKSGNIKVSPKGEAGKSLDLMALLKELEGRNLKSPLLLRFDDILEDRLKTLHEAFDKAILQCIEGLLCQMLHAMFLDDLQECHQLLREEVT